MVFFSEMMQWIDILDGGSADLLWCCPPPNMPEADGKVRQPKGSRFVQKARSLEEHSKVKKPKEGRKVAKPLADVTGEVRSPLFGSTMDSLSVGGGPVQLLLRS